MKGLIFGSYNIEDIFTCIMNGDESCLAMPSCYYVSTRKEE